MADNNEPIHDTKTDNASINNTEATEHTLEEDEESTLSSEEESSSTSSSEEEESTSDEESDDDEEEVEPRLKYNRITQLPVTVFNKDPVSTCLTSESFFAFATHNGVVHLTKPDFTLIRSYRAHRASILGLATDGTYLASASIDGTVVIGSVLEADDISASNFKRPVHSVALDPNYKSSKTFISGGMAGDVILAKDGIVATERDLNDKIEWLVDHRKLEDAWNISANVKTAAERYAIGLNWIESLVDKDDWVDTARNKRALKLVLEELQDPDQAIEFAKQQNDQELWDDLLDYCLTRPLYLKTLLDKASGAVPPAQILARIPVKLAIPGLKDTLLRIFTDHEIVLALNQGILEIVNSEAQILAAQLRAARTEGTVLDFAKAGVDFSQTVVVLPDGSLQTEVDLIGEPWVKDASTTTTVTRSVRQKVKHLAFIKRKLQLLLSQ
ncbi:hypothetical protein D0Z00_000426 [Geotrichum galactomycetum]|uniref:Uncharacterized protein n=1 Tax=Geotrichum galactomycetum TaxID=27317 RepID=A0ACB6VA24_9ASCO|nr:hypothetical protein D0Z00_000426 [Geotrichum candidum]